MKKFFIIDNKLVPFIGGGSVEYLGSTLSLSFDGTGGNLNQNTSKSSDILFMQLAIGQGPLYRINPNGPQDIEIDEKFIDDLVDFNTNNTRSDLFVARYVNGTKTQQSMPSFSEDIVVPIRFASPVTLKSGISSSLTQPSSSATSIEFFPTSGSSGIQPIDSVRIKFNVRELRAESAAGSEPAQLGLVALLHDKSETSNINNYINGAGMIVNSLVTGGMATELEIKVPEDKKSSDGYNVSILKVTDDIAEDGYISEVEVIGFDEIRKESFSYPGTAIAGYAVKASDFRTDSLPTYTSLIKGSIVDVPSNYNQPILESGEVDWRQIELPNSGDYSPSANGYRTQEFGSEVLTSSDINIYKGIWDGTYKKDWTENRVWIIRHILVDIIGVPESAIDKYNFYNVAQYADAVDPVTGNFVGVDGFADGSFRHKPNGYSTEVVNNLLGIPEGTPIKERRFVCGLSITDNVDAWSVVSALAAGMRAVLSSTGGKIRIVIDKPDVLPVAVFNETNIREGSFSISGVRTEDLPSGVEVSYLNVANHFRKETIVLDASDERGSDNIKRLSIDATACNRKGEALRLAKYHLDTSRQLRRRIQFDAFTDASDLEVGDIISVSHKISGLSYGFGGIVFSNSSVDSSTVTLEYLASPSITESTITSNLSPLVVKFFSQNTNKIDYYIVSNTSYNLSSSNVSSGYDLISLNILERLDYSTRTFQSNTAFSEITAPTRGDLWALGEINPTSLSSDTSSKLFKIDSLSVTEEGITAIAASEYKPEILSSLDSTPRVVSSINKSKFNYVTPPVPVLSLKSIPSRSSTGTIAYNMVMASTTDSTNYEVPVNTIITYGEINTILEPEFQETVE